MVVDNAPAGFVGWIQANGQIVLFFAQLIYWLVICVAAVWATLLFRKLVAAKTVASEAASSMPSTPAPVATAVPSDASVSVDEFVD